MRSDARLMHPRHHRFFFSRRSVALRSNANAVVTEFGNAINRARDGGSALSRIRENRGRESLQPSFALFISDRRHHEQIARASGGDIEDADCFFVLATTLL